MTIKKMIQTVLGPMPIEDMRRTLIHEHIFISYVGAELDFTMPFEREKFVPKAVDRLKALLDHGVNVFVDPCPIELGRDVALMAEVSEKSGMNVVCTTGFYFDPSGLPYYWQQRSAEEIAELYIREIEYGIGDTGIKAGAIKTASGAPHISKVQQKFLTAAAIAHMETGVPIITHTEDGCCGPDQQRIFKDAGAGLHNCVIGHSCGNPDPAYHKKIVDNGSYIGFDRIGAINFVPDETRADNVVHLLNGGYRDQLLMSQDRFCDVRGKIMFDMPPHILELIAKRRMEGKWPLPFTDLFTRFFPMLRERGVSDEDIEHVLSENPRRLFSGRPFS